MAGENNRGNAQNIFYFILYSYEQKALCVLVVINMLKRKTFYSKYSTTVQLRKKERVSS